MSKISVLIGLIRQRGITTRSLLAVSLLLFAWSAPAQACVPPVERALYQIEHEVFGNIGRQEAVFRCSGDQLVVETTLQVAVKMLAITVYQREAHYYEVWQDGRLVRFESQTNDNGELTAVSAQAVGDRLIIDGPNGRRQVPLTVVPNHPWNMTLVDRKLLFDVNDGTLLRVDVVDGGKEPIEVGGRRILARKYFLSGDCERELWYADAGEWVKWRLRHAEGAVTMTRQVLG